MALYLLCNEPVSKNPISSTNRRADGISDTAGDVIYVAASKVETRKQVYNLDFMRGLSIIILRKNRSMSFVRIVVNV